MARRRNGKLCIDPLSATVLAVGSFTAGLLVERQTKLTRQAQAEATKRARAVATKATRAVEDKTESVRKALLKKTQGFESALLGGGPGPRNNRGSDYRKEVLNAFFEHSRISPEALRQGIVDLTFYVYDDRDDYEDAERPTGPFDLKNSAFWARLRPGNVVEVFIRDPDDEDAELADADSMVLEVTGDLGAERAAAEAHEDTEYGKAARSHKGNGTKKNKPARKNPMAAYPYYIMRKSTGRAVGAADFREDAEEIRADLPFPKTETHILTAASVRKKYGKIVWESGKTKTGTGKPRRNRK